MPIYVCLEFVYVSTEGSNVFIFYCRTQTSKEEITHRHNYIQYMYTYILYIHIHMSKDLKPDVTCRFVDQFIYIYVCIRN